MAAGRGTVMNVDKDNGYEQH